MITNSDIYLHKCDMDVLNKLNTSNIVFAMTRYEHDFSCLQIHRFYGSHDSFIFKSPVNIDIDSIQHNQNVLGSENVVCYELRKNNVTIHNPCYQIIIVHLHVSAVRNPRSRINQSRSSWCRPNIILTDSDKISVIISTHNKFSSLLNMIKSVKNQTYKNLEIIVVNNCSTEQEYYDYDWNGNNIIIIILKEQLNGHQYNLGIDLSTGKYITLSTDTDYWFPKKLELQLNQMIKTDCKMCCTDGLIGTDEYNSKKKYKKYNAEHYYNSLKNIYKSKGSVHLDSGFPKIWNLDFLKVHNCIINSSVIIHKDIIDKTGKNISISHGQDYDYWLKALQYTDCVYIEDNCFYYKSNK